MDDDYGSGSLAVMLIDLCNSTVWQPSAIHLNYQEYLRSEHWITISAGAKARAGHLCQMCNKGGELHTHHRTYERLGNELPGDLIVLCKACHNKFHKETSTWQSTQF
jgi:5-methylcytosine-specific restriction endonuclease McrA